MRTSRVAALALWTLSMALAITGMALLVVDRDAVVPDNWGFRGYSGLATPFFATAGTVIARRQPRNPIGWLLLVSGVSMGFGGFAQEYAIRGILVTPGALPAAVAVAWLASWTWLFAIASILVLIPQLFPSGRPLTPRWTPLLLGAAAFVVVGFGIFALKPGPTENATFVDNPLPAPSGLAAAIAAATSVLGAAMAAIVGASGLSSLMRFTRARGVEKQQLKWVAASAALCAITFAVMLATGEPKVAQVAVIGAILTLPIAIGIAMSRYHLYDIDILINRALVYGLTTGSIAAGFFGAIIFLQTLLRPITGGSQIAVAVSTLVSVAVFQPLRAAVQREVDQRFYRTRYDASRTIDQFIVRLRDEVDIDAVRRDLLVSVDETLQPATASLWLREASR